MRKDPFQDTLPNNQPMEKIFTDNLSIKLKQILRGMFGLILLVFANTYNVDAQYRERLYANTQKDNVEGKGDLGGLELSKVLGLLGINLSDLGKVSNKLNAVDNGMDASKTYSTLSATYIEAKVLGIINVKLGAIVYQDLNFNTISAANTPVTIKLGNGSSLISTLLDGVSIQALLNGNPVGASIDKNSDVLKVLGGKSASEVTFSPNVPYNGVRVTLNSVGKVLSLNVAQSIDIYDAYIYKDATTLANCDAPIDVLYANEAMIDMVAGVNNPWNAIDNNSTTFARLNSGVSVLNNSANGVSLTAIFPTISKAGDIVQLIVRKPTGIADIGLLNSIGIQTINRSENGLETASTAVSGSLLNIALLGGAGDKYLVTFKTANPFNRIKVWFGGVVAGLQELDVHEISRKAPSPLINIPGLNVATNTAEICEGTAPNVSITDPEVGATYVYYNAEGVVVTAEVTNGGKNFAPMGLPVGSYDFYVALKRAGCGNESDRTKFTIKVNPAPKASDIAIAGNDSPICAGSVTLIPSVVANPSIPLPTPVFRWFKDNSYAQEILTGTPGEHNEVFTINNGKLSISNLTQTTTYYISVASNGNCGLASGALKPVEVRVNPIATNANIISPSMVAACPGNDIVVKPTAPAVVNPVFKYYKDKDKTSLVSNNSMDEGATILINADGELTVSGLVNKSIEYFITVEGSNYCENLEGKSIILKSNSDLSPPEFTANTVIVCSINGSAEFVVTNHINGNIYQVYADQDGLLPVISTFSSNVLTIPNILASGTYYVKVIGGGCSSSILATIHVKLNNQATAADITSFVGNQLGSGTLCLESGVKIVLKATSVINDVTYNFFEDGVLIGSNKLGELEIIPKSYGIAITYGVSIVSPDYCENIVDHKEITITPSIKPIKPIINAPQTIKTELGSKVILEVSPIQAGVTFRWTLNGNNLSEQSAKLTLDPITALNTGIYKVYAVLGNCESDASDAITVDVRAVTFWMSAAVIPTQTTVKGGEDILYTINVKNDGVNALTNYTIKDAIPNHTEFNDFVDPGVFDAGVVSWDNLTISPGTTISRQFKVTVLQDLTGVTEIKNIAYLTNNTDPELMSLAADISNPNIPKAPPEFGTTTKVQAITEYLTWKSFAIPNNLKNVKGGEDVTYDIYVRNKGNQRLDYFTIKDVVPAHTQFVSASNGGVLSANEVNFANLNLPVGATTKVTLIVKVDQNLTGVASILNIASTVVSGFPDQKSIPADPNTPANPGDPSVIGTEIPVILNNNLVSWKTFQLPNQATSVKGGEVITYTIHVRNLSNQDLNNVAVRDPIPLNTQFVSAVNGGSLVGGEVVFPAVLVPFGQTITRTFSVKVNNDLTGVAKITNVGYVKVGNNPEEPTLPPGPTPDDPGDPTNPGTDIPVTSINNFTASLSVSSNSNNGKAHAGDILTYTFEVKNTGNNALTNLNITDPMPEATIFTRANNGGSLNGQSAQFTTAKLDVDQSYTATLEVTVGNNLNGMLMITNMAQVASNGVNKNTNRADVETECVAPLSPTGISLTNNTICPGLTHTVTINNPDPNLTYRYYAAATGGIALGSGTSYTTASLNANTTIYVEAVKIAGQCTSATRTAINLPVIVPLTTPTVKLKEATSASVTFEWTQVTGAVGYEISLNNSNTWQIPSSGATGLTQLVSGLSPGASASIRVRAVGMQPCELSAASPSLSANATNPLGDEVYIPNAFSPNGDGRNDVFEVYGNTIAAFKMEVFNQWGQLLFSSSKIGWDGTYKGSLQPSGVYGYKIEVVSTSGKKVLKKGTITLIR